MITDVKTSSVSPMLDNPPLWALLGLKSTFTCSQANLAYCGLPLDKQKQSEIRLAWKILRDSHFGSAYKYLRSTKKILEAGFFDDGLDFDDSAYKEDLPNSITPVVKISDHLKKLSIHRLKKKKLAVLLTTGAFSPIHNGHVQMMNVAKRELEHRGFEVLGGYISPSHDEYVSQKNNGDAALSLQHRLHLCDLTLIKSTWLMSDDWEAKQRVSVPYTEVIRRLEKYLAESIQIAVPIEVVYVMGSDNAAYTRAFIHLGRCICVERFGYKKPFEQLSNEKNIKDNDRIIFVKYEKSLLRLSSNAIRHGQSSSLDPEIEKNYLSLKNDRKFKD